MTKPNEKQLEAQQRHELKEELHAAFDEKELVSVHDRRRIMRGVLGRDVNMSTIESEEIKTLLAYLKSKMTDELKSNLIGWFSITPLNQGMTKVHMRELTKEIPSTLNVALVHVQTDKNQAFPMSIYGYVENEQYLKQESMILETLRSIQESAPAPLTAGTYTMDRNLTLRLLDDRIPYANSKRRRI